MFTLRTTAAVAVGTQALGIALLCLLAPACAAPRDDDAATGPVRRSEYLDVAGARLYLLTRGAHRDRPSLLWLHGGPGGAERPLFRYYDGGLEKDYVVTYWDQRGAGRSFDPAADPADLTIARHLADLDAVVEHLRRVLHQQRIVLVGHSWGAALGLLYVKAHPQKVAAFIGVDPLVSTRRQELAQYRFVLAEARRRNDGEALAHLQALGPPPYPSAKESMQVDALADRYGAIYHRRPNRFWVLLQGVLRGLVSPWEVVSIIHGNNVSLAAMHDELQSLDLAGSVPSVNVPVVFFLGRYDRHVDARIAAAYLRSLTAPVKRVVWFEHSAHNIPFEEPRRFQAQVVDVLSHPGI